MSSEPTLPEAVVRALGRLAFNLDLIGYEGTVARSAAAYFAAHVRRRKRYRLPQGTPAQATGAAPWFALAERAGILDATNDAVAFRSQDVRADFCRRFLAEQPIDAALLRLTARASFRRAWQLRAGGDPAATEALRSLCLTAASPVIRACALRVLGWLPGPGLFEVLVTSTRDPARRVRLEAARALGELGDGRAFETLWSLAKTEHGPEVGMAAHRLWQTATPTLPAPEKIALFDRMLSAGETALPWFLPLEPDIADHVVALMLRGDFETRSRAAHALGALGHAPAASAMVALIADPAPVLADADPAREQSQRRLIGYALLDLVTRASAPAEVFDPLCDVWANEGADPGLRQRVGVILGQVRHPKAARLLIDALDHHEVLVRYGAIEGLERAGGDEATRALVPLLGDPDRGIRLAVVRCLGVIGSEASLGALVGVLRGGDSSAATEALRRAREAAAHTTTYERVLELASDAVPRVRRNAAEALAALGDPRACEVLIELVGDPSKEVRREAIYVLARMDCAGAIERLRRAWNEEDALRGQIAYALGMLGDFESIARVMAGAEASARETFLLGLRKRAADGITPVAEEALMTLLAHPEWQMRGNVALVLAAARSERALALLVDRADHDENLWVRLSAIQALGEIGTGDAIAALEAIRQRRSVKSSESARMNRAAEDAIHKAHARRSGTAP